MAKLRVLHIKKPFHIFKLNLLSPCLVEKRLHCLLLFDDISGSKIRFPRYVKEALEKGAFSYTDVGNGQGWNNYVYYNLNNYFYYQN